MNMAYLSQVFFFPHVDHLQHLLAEENLLRHLRLRAKSPWCALRIAGAGRLRPELFGARTRTQGFWEMPKLNGGFNDISNSYTIIDYTNI